MWSPFFNLSCASAAVAGPAQSQAAASSDRAVTIRCVRIRGHSVGREGSAGGERIDTDSVHSRAPTGYARRRVIPVGCHRAKDFANSTPGPALALTMAENFPIRARQSRLPYRKRADLTNPRALRIVPPVTHFRAQRPTR